MPAYKVIAKRAQLKAIYNITLDEYASLLHKQGGKCAICKKDANSFKRNLAVDHSHSRSTVRGLLCGNCNRAVGMFKEDISIIANAIKYLEESANEK